jgi:hypothetical protein
MNQKGEKETYLIRASLHEEAIEPWVWCNKQNNGYITITNVKNHKCITVYMRRLDENYANKYDQANTYKILNDLKDGKKILVINEFYRKKLDVQTKTDSELIIDNATCWQQFCLCFKSFPHPTTQLANKLAILAIFITVIFGIIPFLLQIISFIKCIVA